MSTAGLTAQLAGFVAGLQFAQIPGEAVDTVRRGVADCVGVMLAGRDEPVVTLVRDLVQPGEHGHARVLYDQGRADAADAALVNGTAAHALDYDDTGLDGHPSVVLAPAMFAQGEASAANGRDLIAAYVAGYEVWAELLARDADKHHGKGWHPTAVFGTVAAAAVAARLARLDAARCAHALGIAASMASGLVSNFGSMTKPFQAGRAAQNGVLAARLAARGMTASADALEHPNGFLAAISPAGRIRTEGAIAAGRDWHLLRLGINIKRYPVCYSGHRCIDAMLDLAAGRRIEPKDVTAVEMVLGRAQSVPLRQHAPRTALDAKFSGEFAMACALVTGRVGMAELTDEFVLRADIQALIPKVRLSLVDEKDPDDPLFAPHDIVRVTLADGTRLESAPVRHARGHARNPVSLDELRAKFLDCTAGQLAAAEGDRLFGRLAALEQLTGAEQLYAG